MFYPWDGQVVSGPEYIDAMFKWFLETIKDKSLFVIDKDKPWPVDFKNKISKMHTRILRIFCILFHCEYEHLSEDEGKLAHLKTELKHFIFFACYWDLLNFDGPDALPLKRQIDSIRSQYAVESVDWKQRTLLRYQKSAAESRDAFFEEQQENEAYTPVSKDIDSYYSDGELDS